MSKSLDNLAMNLVRLVFLLSAIFWEALMRISEFIKNDPDWNSFCEERMMSGYMLFGNIEMLPEEYLEIYLWSARALIIGIPIAMVWKFFIMPVFG